MIRKWLLASLACGGFVLGMVGCGDDTSTDTKPKTKVTSPVKPTTPEKPSTDKPPDKPTTGKTE